MNDELEKQQDDFGLDEVQKIFDELNAEEDKKRAEEEEVDAEEADPQEEEEVDAEEADPLDEEKPHNKLSYRNIKRRLWVKNEQLKEEKARNLELMQKLEDSLFLGTEHYSQNAELKLRAVKEKAKEAMRAGNEDEYLDYMEEMYRYTSALDQANSWKQQEEVARSKSSQHPSYAEENALLEQEIAEDWIAEHPEVDPESKTYNKKLAMNLGKYVSELDEEIKESGRKDYYLSPGYFRNIENKLSQLKKSSTSSSAPSVGGVRNSFSGGKRLEAQKVVLTADEKRMCDNSNGQMTYKDFIKYKLEDMRSGDRI